MLRIRVMRFRSGLRPPLIHIIFSSTMAVTGMQFINIDKVFPKLSVVAPLTIVVKTIYAISFYAFMASRPHEQFLGVFFLLREA